MSMLNHHKYKNATLPTVKASANTCTENELLLGTAGRMYGAQELSPNCSNPITKKILERITGQALQKYTQAPLLLISPMEQSLLALEFEKKICRISFKNRFGSVKGFHGVKLSTNIGLLDSNPTLNSSRWVFKNSSKQNNLPTEDFIPRKDTPSERVHTALPGGTNMALPVGTMTAVGTRRPQIYHQKFRQIFHTDAPKKKLDLTCNTVPGFEKGRAINLLSKVFHTAHSDKRLLHSGVQLMSSSWVLEQLIEQIQTKRSVRGVIYALIRDAEALLNHMQTTSPVIGVRVTATGRLGRKKKAMSQQLTQSIGKVPLGTFNRKVDYSQGFVVTKFGMVGLKVWIAFA